MSDKGERRQPGGRETIEDVEGRVLCYVSLCHPIVNQDIEGAGPFPEDWPASQVASVYRGGKRACRWLGPDLLLVAVGRGGFGSPLLVGENG